MSNWIQRPWGKYREVLREAHYVVKLLVIEAGKRTSLQAHSYRRENLVVTKGLLHLEIQQGGYILYPGNHFVIPPGWTHRLRADTNNGECQIVEVWTPSSSDFPILDELDIIRHEDDFGRASRTGMNEYDLRG